MASLAQTRTGGRSEYLHSLPRTIIERPDAFRKSGQGTSNGIHADQFLLAIEDITARSRAEDALREANQNLQHFAYAASHDLQEPLRMVTSYTQLLAKQHEGKLDKLADPFIGYAVEGAQRMEMFGRGSTGLLGGKRVDGRAKCCRRLQPRS